MKEEQLYIVRLWDMFDGWIDLTDGIPKEQAEAIWNEKTGNGTRNTKYNDGDYYAIFEANTKMLITPETLGR